MTDPAPGSPRVVGPHFLVLSAPRSGSTLLARMLDAHSKLRVPDETGFLVYAFGVDRIFKRRITRFNHRQVFRDSPRPPWTEPFATPSDFFDRFARHYRESENMLLGEKTPAHWWFVPTIREHLPGTKLIFLVRNPIAVVSSCRRNRISMFPVFRPPHAGGLDVLVPALVWKRAFAQWPELSKNPNALLLRYEDLVTNPAGELTRICAHLGVPFEEGMLDFHQRIATKSLPGSDGSPHHKKLSEPVATDRLEAADGLSAEDVRRIRHLLHAEMTELGYAGDPAPEPPYGLDRALARAERYFSMTVAGCGIRERLKQLLANVLR